MDPERPSNNGSGAAFPPWLKAPLGHLAAWTRGGRLASGLLLVGPEGVGKGLLARTFLQWVACTESADTNQPCGACNGCRSFLGGSHPEILEIVPEAPGKEILVDAVREVIDFLSLSHAGPARVVLISSAESMNANAANALLKTLEEPPAGATLLLTATRPARLPPTIRSRCQPLRIPHPEHRRMVEWLNAGDNAELAVDEALAASMNRPMAARDLLQDPEAIERWQRDRDALNALLESRSPFPVIDRFTACEPGSLVPRLQCLLVSAQRWLVTEEADAFGRLFDPAQLAAFAQAHGLRGLARLLQSSQRWHREMAAALNPQLRCEEIVLALHGRTA
ncbi:DNA polymerase III delta prime subunit [Thioalkalivibrio nitratireducens DSM 14787]|uniref:DNA-directed DNA polymerase n=1 Tax=Thioalkalivibrio nitratireducens (strain DSM 14787 / UNIQEM 213 / ALEN2) TaxID=1255043 RepID=L0DUH9_THIND|nr:DNA polymerase III subunit delta' [Thioalkalivibrio nitratireducens]AGA33254.1 DNA polymerase III delta prime subunit [Thioalkalivibrio nitratireducens DSM 14787]